MPELIVMQGSDCHEDIGQLQAMTYIAEKENVDATLMTGDLLGKSHQGVSGNHKTLDDAIAKNLSELKNSQHVQTIQAIIEKNQITDLKNIDDIADKQDKAQLTQAYQAHTQELQQAVIGAVVQSCEKLKPHLQKLADKTKIFYTEGNHDLTILREIFSDIMDFVNLKPSATIKGKSGIEFIIKGTSNTKEVPQLYASNPAIQEILGPYFINYAEGHSEKEHPEAKKAQQATRDRLGQAGPADIFLTHIQPDSYMGAHGEATEEEAVKSGAVYAGHGHGGEITIHNGKIVFRPGTNHVFVSKYNAKKEIETVKIYKIRDSTQLMN